MAGPGRPRIQFPDDVLTSAVREGWSVLQVWTALESRGIPAHVATIRARLREARQGGGMLGASTGVTAPLCVSASLRETSLCTCPGCREERHPRQFVDADGAPRELCSVCDGLGARYPFDKLRAPSPSTGSGPRAESRGAA